jgi:hypothetical protein
MPGDLFIYCEATPTHKNAEGLAMGNFPYPRAQEGSLLIPSLGRKHDLKGPNPSQHLLPIDIVSSQASCVSLKLRNVRILKTGID